MDGGEMVVAVAEREGKRGELERTQGGEKRE